MNIFHRLPLSRLALIGLLLMAAFLRLYNLKDTLQFQGDQGRDSLIVSKIFTAHDPVFIGPVTSVGNMYLGPLYYYFMMPFLWLSYPSPMGPVYAVAVLGILTVLLLYYLGRKMVGEKAAIMATILYTFSSVTVHYTRFSWNPNPAPLMSLLMMYFTYLAWKPRDSSAKNRWYWVAVAACFSVLLQLHYLTLLSLGGAGLIWLLDFLEIWKLSPAKRFKQLKQLLIPTMIGALLVLMSFTPLVLFDSKHDWLNATAFQKLVFQDENFKVTKNTGLIPRAIKTSLEMHGRSMQILFEITIGKVRWLNTLLLVGVVGLFAWLLKQGKKQKTFYGELILGAYFITGVVGTALYEHTVFDHYIAYLFPVSFLMLGVCLSHISKHRLGRVAVGAFIIGFLWYNIPLLPLKPVGWTIDDMKIVSDSIYEKVKPGEKYNVVLISPTKDYYAQNYRYFLTTTDHPPVTEAEIPQTETLFIINEDPTIKKVVDSPVSEIVIFPDKTPKEVYYAPHLPADRNGGPSITVLSTHPDRLQ